MREAFSQQRLEAVLGPDWPKLARLIIHPEEVANCGLWPDQMRDPMSRVLLEALQRLDGHRQPITIDTLNIELMRCGHHAQEILRRLRLAMRLLDRMEILL